MAITVSIQSRNGKELVKGGIQLPEEVNFISTSDALGNLVFSALEFGHDHCVARHNGSLCILQRNKASSLDCLGPMD